MLLVMNASRNHPVSSEEREGLHLGDRELAAANTFVDACRRVRISLRAKCGDKPQLQRESATLIFDDPTRLLTLTVTANVTPSNLLTDVAH